MKAPGLDRTRHFASPLIARRAAVVSSQVRLERARQKAIEVARVDEELRRDGVTSRAAIARELNSRGITAPRGGRWTAAQVCQQLHYSPVLAGCH